MALFFSQCTLVLKVFTMYLQEAAAELDRMEDKSAALFGVPVSLKDHLPAKVCRMLGIGSSLLTPCV